MEAASQVLNTAVSADRAGQAGEATRRYEEGIRLIREQVLPTAAPAVASQAASAVARYQQRIAELKLVRKRQQREDERRLALRYGLLRRGRVGTGADVEPVSDAALRGDSSTLDRECQELERRFQQLKGTLERQPAPGELEARMCDLHGDDAGAAPPAASSAAASNASPPTPKDTGLGNGDECEDADKLAERLVAQARDELRLGIAEADGEEDARGGGATKGGGEASTRRRHQRRESRGCGSDASSTSSTSSPLSSHTSSSDVDTT